MVEQSGGKVQLSPNPTSSSNCSYRVRYFEHVMGGLYVRTSGQGVMINHTSEIQDWGGGGGGGGYGQPRKPSIK